MKAIKVILDNIRNERIKKGFSQEYMGLCLKKSQNAYSKMELGTSKITLANFLRIAEILELDPISLMSGDVLQVA